MKKYRYAFYLTVLLVIILLEVFIFGELIADKMIITIPIVLVITIIIAFVFQGIEKHREKNN